MRLVSPLTRLLLLVALVILPLLPWAPAVAEAPDAIRAQEAGRVFLPAVMRTLGPGHAVRNAYDTLIEFAALKQLYMIEVVKAFTNGYTAKFMDTVPTYLQVDAVFARQADLWSRQGQVERALQTIEWSQIQGGAPAGLNAQGIGSALKGFWSYLSGSGERSRNRVLTVASNYNESQRQRLYDQLRPEWKDQAGGSEDFWQKFQGGEFDSQAPQIFNDLYHFDEDFGLDAMDKDLTIQHIVHREGAEGVTKGAELMVEVVKTVTPLGEGMDLVDDAAEYAQKIETALTDPKQFIKDEVKDAIADKLGGFIDIDGLVDSGALSETAAEAIKILTDVCLDSDDPADWFKDAIDWGIGKVYDSNQGGVPADIAVADNHDASDLLQTIISLLGTTNLTGGKEVTVGVPGGDWTVTAVNQEGTTDAVEAHIAKDETTLIVASTEPGGGHSGGGYSLSVWISPASPGAWNPVTVYARVGPATANVQLSFSVTGTDGYSDSDVRLTGADGTASFYVPGGEKGVVDTITVTMVSQGLTRTLVYSFA